MNNLHAVKWEEYEDFRYPTARSRPGPPEGWITSKQCGDCRGVGKRIENERTIFDCDTCKGRGVIRIVDPTKAPPPIKHFCPTCDQDIHERATGRKWCVRCEQAYQRAVKSRMMERLYQ